MHSFIYIFIHNCRSKPLFTRKCMITRWICMQHKQLKWISKDCFTVLKCELRTHEYYSFITAFDIRVCKLLELFISIPLLILFIHKLNCIYSHVIHLVFTCYSHTNWVCSVHSVFTYRHSKNQTCIWVSIQNTHECIHSKLINIHLLFTHLIYRYAHSLLIQKHSWVHSFQTHKYSLAIYCTYS